MNNGYEEYRRYNVIYLKNICDVEDNGDGLSLRIDFKDCNIPVYLSGDRKKIFLEKFWNNRRDANVNSIQFLINGEVVK